MKLLYTAFRLLYFINGIRFIFQILQNSKKITKKVKMGLNNKLKTTLKELLALHIN